jgi:hypothetical protein
LAAKKAKETLAAQKAEAKAQKAAAREQARSARLQANAQKGQATQANLEDHKVVIQQKVEAIFGAGLLSNSLLQKGHSGNVRGALKLAQTVLSQSGKPPEEQQAFFGTSKAI